VEQPPADHKYSKAKVEALAKSNDQGKGFFKKQFPGYTIADVKPEYYEETGWHIYLKMWRKPDKKPKKGGRNGQKK